MTMKRILGKKTSCARRASGRINGVARLLVEVAADLGF
jgi:hypothetical protein